jgi:hypothetical protein
MFPYGALNEAFHDACSFRLSANSEVICNLTRFPADFMFQLTTRELENRRSQIVTSNPAAKMGLRRPPYAFTEHGGWRRADF